VAHTGIPHELPYPVPTDDADGPAAFQSLAERTADRLPYRDYKKSVIHGQQLITSPSYASLGTPDRVTDLRVEADGIVTLRYFAMVNLNAVKGAVGIFVTPTGSPPSPSDQVRLPISGGNGLPTYEIDGKNMNAATDFGMVFSAPWGLQFYDTHATSPTIAATGTILAGINVVDGPWGIGPGTWNIEGVRNCQIVGLPAGQYDVEIKYRTDAGGTTMRVRERYLWVASERPLQT